MKTPTIPILPTSIRALVLTTARITMTVALAFAATPAIQGAVRTWDGGHGNWSNPSNWDPVGVPSDGDELRFVSTGLNYDATNDLVGLNLEKITIAAGIDLYGNPVGLSSELFAFISHPLGAAIRVYLDIDLDADVTITAYPNAAINGTLYIYGDIDTGSHVLNVGDYGILASTPVYLSGSVSGGGSVVKFGDDTVRMEGAGNTYSGLTTVEEGTLILAKSSGNSVPSGLIIGGNSASDPSATVQQQASAEILGSVTINRMGTYDMNGYSEAIVSLNLNGGADFDSGSATLTITGNVTVDGGVSTIDGLLSLYSGNHYFDILYNGLILWPGAHCYLDADVSGAGNLIKRGPGYMRMYGNNSYSGTTTVETGRVMIESDTALGSTAGGTTVNAGSTLYISLFNAFASRHIGNEALTLAGTVDSGGISNSWTGDIVLTDNAVVDVYGKHLNLVGVISGTGGFTKDGDGTLILSGSTANSYTGDTHVDEGTLLLNKSGYNAVRYGSLTIGDGAGSADEVIVREQDDFQIGDSVPVTVNVDGWLNADAYSDTVGAITFNGGHAGSTTGSLRLGGHVTVNASASEALLDGNVQMGSGTRTFAVAEGSVGYELRVTAVLSGYGFTKTGEGLMALQAANTFTGPATVNEGRLYVLNNDAFGTTAGGTVVGPSGFIQLLSVDIGLEPLTLGRTAAGSVMYTSGDSSWAGDVVLNEDAVLGAGGSLGFSGVISGSGGITWNGAGDLILSGTANNAYTGPTLVKDGQLLMNKTSSYRSIDFGSLTVGDGVGAAGSAVARELSQYELGSIPITVNGDGLLDLNGFYDTVGNSLTLNDGGDVQTGSSGTLALGSNSQIMTGGAGSSSSINGNINVSSGACTFDVGNSLHVYASMSGSANITKTGGSSLYLRSSNSFTGTMTVEEAYLSIYDPWALGSDAAGTYVNNAAFLGVHTAVANESLTMNSSHPSYALYSAGSPASWSGPVTLLQGTTVAVNGGYTLDISGPIDGAGGLVKLDDGTLVLSGSSANTYGGDTRVDVGTLVLNKSIYNQTIPGDLYIGDGVGGADADVARLLTTSQIPTASRVIIANSGLFDMNNLTELIGSLAGSGSVDMGSGNLLTGSDNTSSTFSGVIDGSGYVQKNGVGTFILEGNNTYTGTTDIQSGTLLVNGSQPGSDVVVSSSGTLGGIGTVGAINSGGSVSPGASPGQLGSGSATLQSGSSFHVDLDGDTLVDYDQLDVGGSVSLGNSDLNVSCGFVPTVGDEFTIIDNDGADAVAGTFNGLAPGDTIVVGNVTLKITYTGGTGNDVVLVVSEVEPTEDLRITSIETVGGNVALEWTGGVPLYVVEKKTALTNAIWIPVTAPMSGTQTNLPMTAPAGFYRVKGSN